MRVEEGKVRAPEIGRRVWLNSAPLIYRQLRGDTVLVDSWVALQGAALTQS